MRQLIIALLMLLPVAAMAAAPVDSTANKVKFSWGAECGSSIDMSGHDMSSIDFNGAFGMRRGWIKFLGVGAAANIMVSNSCRTYPIFAIFQPSIPRLTDLIFLDLRLGAALNYLPNNVNQTDAYGAISIGFNLARGRKYRSYILAGYSYNGRRDATVDGHLSAYPPLHLALVRLGIAF